MEYTDTSVTSARACSTARVATMAITPTSSGSDAATADPNTSRRPRAVIGKAMRSARPRSDSTVRPTSS